MNRVSKPEFLEEVVKKGEVFAKRLEEIKSKVSIIGDVRGKGLMRGIEFVDPKSQSDSLGAKKASGEIAALVQKRCFENRLVMEKGGRNGAVMRCLCALNVTMEDLEKALDIIEKVIIEVDLEQK